MTPSGKFSSRRVFLLKLTNDNFPPSSAVHANMTVCQVFISFPVVFMLTVLVPFMSVVVVYGMSKVSGILVNISQLQKRVVISFSLGDEEFLELSDFFLKVLG